MSAVAMAETARPARISVIGPPWMPASATTASMASAAPISPPSGSASDSVCGDAEMDGQHRAERGAAGDADQARLGQGVAQIALQGRAGEAERAPTSAPNSARGRRISQKMSEPASPPGPKPKPEGPMASERTNARRARPAKRGEQAPWRVGSDRLGHRGVALRRSRAAVQLLDGLDDMRRAAQPELPRQLEGGVLSGAIRQRGVAQIVGGRRAVGVARARQHEQIGRLGHQQLERQLSIAGQG